MTDLVPFDFEGKTVRVIDVGGEPWFVARDVCDVLDLGNPRSSLALLDDDEKGVHNIDTPGGPQKSAIINEAGLYSLILRSRKPEAKRFKRWVTHEVLPSIRKTGSYGHIPVPAGLPDFTDPIVAARAWADEKEGRQIAETKLVEQAPKVAGYDRIARAADSSLNITQAAKVVKVKRPALIDWMIDNHWLYRVQSNNRLTAHSYGLTIGYLEMRYTDVEQKNGTVRAFPQPLVTAKGVAKLAAEMADA